ncbi:MAG: glycosyltransferase [Flavitalea sp.]
MIKTSCDIICFSLSRWDAPISSPSLALAKELAKTNRVFFIDHPFSWKDYIREKHSPQVIFRKQAMLKGESIYYHPPPFPEKLTTVCPPVIYPINFLPAGRLYNAALQVNENRMVKLLRRVIRENSIRQYVFINFFDPFFLRKIPEDIKPLRMVYQSMDDISQVAYSRRHGVALEKEIVRRADVTLCTSLELTRKQSALSPNVHYHPNAADTTLFQRAVTGVLPKPPEMQGISGRIIGFMGSIEYRTDFELLRKAALYHHDKTLFLLGPVSGNEHIKAGLDKLPNVVFAGAKNIEELPAYLQYFDCAIIPYKINKLTKSIYPLKINEYLAAGKPVVATHFSEDIYAFREVAQVVKGDNAFCRAIDKSIFEDDDEKRMLRRHTAEQHTWKKRVEQFWEIIQREPLNRL